MYKRESQRISRECKLMQNSISISTCVYVVCEFLSVTASVDQYICTITLDSI